MPDLRDVTTLLDKAGAILISRSAHLKYRLPNNEILVMPNTPSDHRSYANCLSTIRRKLKDTHPTLVNNFGRSLPKHKRGSSIRDQLSAKNLLVEAEFQIVTEPEPEPTPAYKPPRQHHETTPKFICKTLSREQLDEANRILRSAGPTAMNEYIAVCRANMVVVTPDVIEERHAQPVRVPVQHTPTEDEEMSNMLERTRKELEASRGRIAAYQKTIADTQAVLEMETVKASQLEEYIVEHETLVSKQVMIADLLPPEEKAPEPVVAPVVRRRKGKVGSKPRLPYGIAEVRERVFPILRQQSATFDMTEFMAAAKGVLEPLGDTHQLRVWLHSEAQGRSSSQIKVVGRGRFGFRDMLAEERIALAAGASSEAVHANAS